MLDAIAAEHPRAEDLLDFCRAENARIEAFCRERDLIGLADEPLEIRWTPVFLRAFGGAMLSSPGPLDKGQKAFFAITPMPDDWTDEQRESNLREDNDRMLRLLTIHEAVPGHYLQGVYANRCPSIVRAIFGSGLFAEGWAVYVTQVMMDVGYGADDPALLLTHWKFYLRAITNAIIDARIHCDGMTEDEAVALMVDGGFQEEAEARAKFDRARLSSTQLSTYFAGSMEMWEIEREVRRRAAIASGDPRGARRRPRAARGRRLRRDARLRLPAAPRVGHRPRLAADVAAPPDPARLSPGRSWPPVVRGAGTGPRAARTPAPTAPPGRPGAGRRPPSAGRPVANPARRTSRTRPGAPTPGPTTARGGRSWPREPAGRLDATTRPVSGSRLAQFHTDLDVRHVVEVEHDVRAAALDAAGPGAIAQTSVEESRPEGRKSPASEVDAVTTAVGRDGDVRRPSRRRLMRHVVRRDGAARS